MKVFVWEGDGISSAYQDDGTLVVLAETPDQARELTRATVERNEQVTREWQERVEKFARDNGFRWGTRVPEGRPGLFESAGFREATAPDPRYNARCFDGSEEALNREPDRVIELDNACVVAFNGGGYD